MTTAAHSTIARVVHMYTLSFLLRFGTNTYYYEIKSLLVFCELIRTVWLLTSTKERNVEDQTD